MQGLGATNGLSRALMGAPADARGAETQAAGAAQQQQGGRDLGATEVSVRQTAQSVDGPDSTAPKFGDVWKKIQADYGAKAAKPREVRKTLGKDDFMRLMIHQMRNQDPTNPFKAEQMAQQMAQYASVEQLQNMNTQMGKLTTANQPLERLAMTGLIGKTVTVSKERFNYTQGDNQQLGFTLPKSAASVKVTVVNEVGEPVATKDLGALKEGSNTFVWDGLQQNTLPAKTGTYAYKVEATDENGSSIPLPTTGETRVIGVSFEGQEPILLVGDPSRPDKIPMSSVSRIAEGESMMIPGAQSLSSASAGPTVARAADPHGAVIAAHHARSGARLGEAQAAPSSDRAFFTFERGKGSTTVDPSQLPADQQALLRGAAAKAYAGSDRGFPNGLNDSSDGGEQ